MQPLSAGELMTLEEKSAALRQILTSYPKLAIAFSGGADSSLLLKRALDVLGPDNVLALSACSTLQKTEDVAQVRSWAARHGYGENLKLRLLAVTPLSWTDFVANGKQRCYHCKSKIYKFFLDEAAAWGADILADGTNADDCREERPGRQAISELGVATPLAAAGLSKKEVRLLSRQLGLDTWNRPSASCLATRIPHHLPITPARLAKIAIWEAFLTTRGFTGCRVRLDLHQEGMIYIQLLHTDLARFTQGPHRESVLSYFHAEKIDKIYLDLAGR